MTRCDVATDDVIWLTVRCTLLARLDFVGLIYLSARLAIRRTSLKLLSGDSLGEAFGGLTAEEKGFNSFVFFLHRIKKREI